MTKKQLLQSVIFLLLFAFLLRTFTYIVRTSGDVKERFAGFYAEKRDTLDVVMIGSSRVYDAYAVPKLYGEYGIAAYMLSSNVQRPAAALPLTKEALKTQHPALFVYDMQMFLREDVTMTDNMAYTRGVTDNLKYSWNRVETIRAMVEPDDAEGRLSYYFDIFKYHTNWKTIVMPSQLRAFRYSAKSPMKGYVMEDTVGHGETTDVSRVTEEAPMPPEQEAHLRALCVFLTGQGQEALFVVTPGVTDEAEKAGYNYIASVLAEYGFPLLNMNDCYEEIGLDFDRDYKDTGNHLNAPGADRVTAFFGDYLVNRYRTKDGAQMAFSDHRGDPAYASWDKAYALWQERFTEAEETVLRRIVEGDYYDPDAE